MFSSNLTKDTLNVQYKHQHKPILMLLRPIIAIDCTNGIINLWGVLNVKECYNAVILLLMVGAVILVLYLLLLYDYL